MEVREPGKDPAARRAPSGGLVRLGVNSLTMNPSGRTSEMADGFERLLTASAEHLKAWLARVKTPGSQRSDSRLESIAREFAMNGTQFICALAFNPAWRELDGLAECLGFASDEDLIAKRNFVFIHDQYRDLSINDVLSVHRMLGTGSPLPPATRDVVMSRLEMVEHQLEETINPILVGSFKLEVRAIYEHGVADRAFALARLSPSYEQTRAIADETRIMLETQVLSGLDVLRASSVSGEEKRRLLFHGLVADTDLETYMAEPGADHEFKRAVMGQA